MWLMKDSPSLFIDLYELTMAQVYFKKPGLFPETKTAYFEVSVRRLPENWGFFVVAGLNRIKGVKCLPSQGAFYSFFDVRDAIRNLEGIEDDVQLAEYLLIEAGVALVPGSAFGQPGYLRLSFATSLDKLQDALKRIGRLLGEVS